ncbi:hypothetical protein PV797_17905 [Clostridiaceae bacterium M8S5]|nr:hypothetical protein PV797_17905 [Clostridiaceae bacterium M8S5]
MNKKKVIFIVSLIAISLLIYLVCFKKPTEIVSYEQSMDEAFIKYQREDMLSPDEYDRIYQFNEAHEVFEVRKKLGRYYVYMYYDYEIKYNEYHTSGGSNPLVVVLKKLSAGTYKVVKLKEPESGDTYVESIRRLFPDYIAEYMLENSCEIVTKLQKNMKQIN